MANNSRKEGKETYGDEPGMTPDMQLMYQAFTSEFQKLNSRLDEMD